MKIKTPVLPGAGTQPCRRARYFFGWVVFEPRLYLNWLPFSDVGGIVSPRSITVRRPFDTLAAARPNFDKFTRIWCYLTGLESPHRFLQQRTLSRTLPQDNDAPGDMMVEPASEAWEALNKTLKAIDLAALGNFEALLVGN